MTADPTASCNPPPGPARSRLPALLVAICLGLCGLSLSGGAAAQSYGAIAYSPQTGQWGWSRNYRSQLAAQGRAMAECHSASRHGCRIVVETRQACASLATGQSGWGTGWGTSRARADAEALAACRRNAQGCATRVGFCSD